MEKTSVRIPPELSKILAAEARKLAEICGENVTVSELIRRCILEKFPEVSERIRKEKLTVAELQDEVSLLKDRCGQLAKDVEKLVQVLAETFPLLATREQVDSLTDGIAAVIRILKVR